jgi:hypothetical protein
VLFKAGKNRDGYFSNKDVLHQANNAMTLLEKTYPGDVHILVYDNAKTHTACRSDALSA